MARRFTEAFPRLAEMVPTEATQEEEREFRKLSLVLTVFPIATFAIAISYLFWGIPEVTVGLLISTPIAVIIRFAYVRATTRRKLIIEAGVFLLCLNLAFVSCFLGGFYDPHFAWFGLVPAGTAVLLGHQYTIRWIIIVCFFAGTFWAIDAVGVEILNQVSDEKRKIHSILNVLCAITTLGVLVRMFVRSQVSAEKRAVAAQKALLKERGRLRVLAHYDSLTTLPNRNSFEQALESALASGGTAALIYLDLDRFRDVNDAFGHTIGDRVLVESAQRFAHVVHGGKPAPEVLSTEWGKKPLLARRGGDEFVVLLPDATGSEAAQLAQRLLRTLSEPVQIDSHRLHLGVSVGIALAPTDGDNVESLVRSADIALSRVKTRGTGGVDFFEEEALQTRRRRVLLETALREAIELEELRLDYQPLFDMDGRIKGAEALLRWDSAVLGHVSPGEFIPIAERSGQMAELGDWVLREACHEAKHWPGDIRVAINVSVAQLRGALLVSSVEKMLRETDLTPSRLELEITESLLADDPYTRSVISDLRSLGVGMALDDFGTGFSSLSVLRQLPVDRLKIDRSFVQSMHNDASDAALVRTIVAMGRELGLHVLAEGVELQEQLRALRLIGCDEVQGYHLSRPISAVEFRALLTESANSSKVVPLPSDTPRETRRGAQKE